MKDGLASALAYTIKGLPAELQEKITPVPTVILDDKLAITIGASEEQKVALVSINSKLEPFFDENNVVNDPAKFIGELVKSELAVPAAAVAGTIPTPAGAGSPEATDDVTTGAPQEVVPATDDAASSQKAQPDAEPAAQAPVESAEDPQASDSEEASESNSLQERIDALTRQRDHYRTSLTEAKAKDATCLDAYDMNTVATNPDEAMKFSKHLREADKFVEISKQDDWSMAQSGKVNGAGDAYIYTIEDGTLYAYVRGGDRQAQDLANNSWSHLTTEDSGPNPEGGMYESVTYSFEGDETMKSLLAQNTEMESILKNKDTEALATFNKKEDVSEANKNLVSNIPDAPTEEQVASTETGSDGETINTENTADELADKGNEDPSDPVPPIKIEPQAAESHTVFLDNDNKKDESQIGKTSNETDPKLASIKKPENVNLNQVLPKDVKLNSETMSGLNPEADLGKVDLSKPEYAAIYRVLESKLAHDYKPGDLGLKFTDYVTGSNMTYKNGYHFEIFKTEPRANDGIGQTLIEAIIKKDGTVESMERVDDTKINELVKNNDYSGYHKLHRTFLRF